MHHTELLPLVAWAHLISNAMRVLTYVPQIVAAWRCPHGAASVSLMTVLIAGGLFLIWKATKEIHHHVDPPLVTAGPNGAAVAAIAFSSVLVQIVLLDMVFSVDSILTAVGMTDNLAMMMIAVITAVAVMLLAAEPLANFINHNPTIVMLALGFLLMIGAMLIADGFGVHVRKGFIYAAMAFSTLVEVLNMLSRRGKSGAA